ncbi:hypothetical protein HYW43_00475 [Candidatus Daviesbacteria bacterium]|nr:hypothetical protein [Candidatus Daviesbacteria bacterium]
MLQNKNLSSIFKKNWFFLAGLFVYLSLIWVYIVPPIIAQNDIQIVRLDEINRCIKDGQIPCRYVPDLKNLYGYPLFNYYAPLPYYFGELIFLLTNSLLFSAKIMLLFSFIGSYIFMYLLINQFLNGLKRTLLALSYSLIPYVIFKLNVKDSIGEMWGLMFLAASFYAVKKLAEQTNIKNLLLASIFLAFLVTSYQLSLLVFLPVLCIFIIILFIKTRKVKFLWFNLAAGFLAILLSAFYLLPMLFEIQLTRSDYLPSFVKETPSVRGLSRYEVLTGDSNVFDFKEGTNWLSFKTDTKTHTIIRLSKYYFPDWKVFVDGKEIQVDYRNNDMGLITFLLGVGNHTINARLYDTPIRALSNLITLAGLSMTMALFLVSFVRVRKWIRYYRKGIN